MLFFPPVVPVGAQTPSSAPHQEEEACNRGASGGAGPQTPAEWSGAPGGLPDHSAEGVALQTSGFLPDI